MREIKSNWDNLMDYIVHELKEAQKDGYVVPDNSDLEVGQWIGGIAYNIANQAEKMMEPHAYVKIDGQFYKKSDIFLALNKPAAAPAKEV